jgi:hypothetical protein
VKATGPGHPLLRFLGLVVALLPACFVAWWYLGKLVAAPAVLLVKLALSAWLGSDVIASITLDGTDMLVLTNLGEAGGEIFSAEAAGNQLGFPIDTRVLSYSIPFYAALHFATPMPAPWERFARALLLLWLLLVVGLVSTALKDLMLGLGEYFLQLPGVPPADAVALAYQFSTLMIPPLAPVVLWALGARDVPAFRALLPAGLGATPPAEASGSDEHQPRPRH